jgi:putative membrane protein
MIRYDPHNWSDHFFDLRGTLLVEIAFRVLACVVWSAGIVAWHFYVYPIKVPITVHSLVGVALGLLLVFRTNASYDRFWEGRRLWGTIVNETRNLARTAVAHFGADRDILNHLIRWTAVFPYTAMSSLRGSSVIGPAGDDLTPEERFNLLKANHLALHASQQMTAILRAAYEKKLITDNLVVAIDQNVQILIDALGACERIRKTPLPFDLRRPISAEPS